jgi:hypothetical protein
VGADGADDRAAASVPCPWPNNPLIPHIPQSVTNFQGKGGKDRKVFAGAGANKFKSEHADLGA